MKKLLMTLCGVTMMTVVTMAQQTDTTSNNASDPNTEIRSSDGSNQATQGQSETQDQSASPTTTQQGATDQSGQTGDDATSTQPQTGQTGASDGTDKTRKKSKTDNP